MLSDTENRIHYECDGSTNSFPITFPYNGDSEIKVYLYNTVTMEDETLITSYNIVDNNVVTNETYSSDYRLTIVRELPLTQDTNLSSSGILPPEVIEERFDKLTMQIQQLQDQLDRTLIMHKSTTYSGLHLPEPENGFFLLWKDGDLINSQYLSSDAASITPYTKTLLDDDNASEALSTLGISDYIKTLLDDIDASTAQSTLGISDYIKTLLDDIDAETARQTLGTDIYATIDFVNASLAAATLNLFLTDTSSSEVSGYYEMLFTETGASGSSLTANSVSDGDLLWSFISPQFDGADQLSAGLYVASLWAEQDSNKTVTLTAKLYKRDSGGTETLLLETSTSDEIPKDTKTQIIMSGFLENDEAINSTDRVVLKIYANVSGGGGAPNITIYMEGTDDSRIAVRIPTSVITSKIFDADGDTLITVEETADEDVIHFYTAGSERVKIDEDGGLILNTNADYSLYINSTKSSANIALEQASPSQKWEIRTNYAGNDTKFYIYDRTNNRCTLLIDSSGYIGINDPTPSQKLDVNGNVRADDFIEYSQPLPEEKALPIIMAMKNKKDGTLDHSTFPNYKEEMIENEDGTKTIKKGISLSLQVKYLIKAMQELYPKLTNLQEQINDIRQSTTKESIN